MASTSRLAVVKKKSTFGHTERTLGVRLSVWRSLLPRAAEAVCRALDGRIATLAVGGPLRAADVLEDVAKPKQPSPLVDANAVHLAVLLRLGILLAEALQLAKPSAAVSAAAEVSSSSPVSAEVRHRCLGFVAAALRRVSEECRYPSVAEEGEGLLLLLSAEKICHLWQAASRLEDTCLSCDGPSSKTEKLVRKLRRSPTSSSCDVPVVMAHRYRCAIACLQPFPAQLAAGMEAQEGGSTSSSSPSAQLKPRPQDVVRLAACRARLLLKALRAGDEGEELDFLLHQFLLQLAPSAGGQPGAALARALLRQSTSLQAAVRNHLLRQAADAGSAEAGRRSSAVDGCPRPDEGRHSRRLWRCRPPRRNSPSEVHGSSHVWRALLAELAMLPTEETLVPAEVLRLSSGVAGEDAALSAWAEFVGRSEKAASLLQLDLAVHSDASLTALIQALRLETAQRSRRKLLRERRGCDTSSLAAVAELAQDDGLSRLYFAYDRPAAASRCASPRPRHWSDEEERRGDRGLLQSLSCQAHLLLEALAVRRTSLHKVLEALLMPCRKRAQLCPPVASEAELPSPQPSSAEDRRAAARTQLKLASSRKQCREGLRAALRAAKDAGLGEGDPDVSSAQQDLLVQERKAALYGRLGAAAKAAALLVTDVAADQNQYGTVDEDFSLRVTEMLAEAVAEAEGARLEGTVELHVARQLLERVRCRCGPDFSRLLFQSSIEEGVRVAVAEVESHCVASSDVPAARGAEGGA
eukprot:TRINITY_DN39516_c0_g1_i1.p1 TRINITY_DN39516_c0_g1~~TRINITY_DN39516_c0_g1_i1.p1  ORF type:complete len:752 (-),score=183.30 TRINITY_DN39516_c0_g1_i1:54-2309(-)